MKLIGKNTIVYNKTMGEECFLQNINAKQQDA